MADAAVSGTIEKRAEIDPEAAAWIVRGAEMIAREGKSPIELARLFNEQKVGGRQTWSDNMIRKLYSRERLVGREVFRTTRQDKNRTTGKVRYVKLPQDQWLVRESPHLRILPDELADPARAKLNLAAQSFGRIAKDRTKKLHRADLYPKVLIRPICGGCGTPMISGLRSASIRAFAASTPCTGFMAVRTATTSQPGSSPRRCSAPSWRRSSPMTSSPTSRPT